MISIISPAKGFIKIPLAYDIKSSDAIFKDETKNLIDILQQFSIEEISSLMKTSEQISLLNYNRFKNFYNNNLQEHNALLYINGEAFKGIDASTLNDKDLLFAQDNLRILSGLYGIIRPLDKIKEYRLEMGTKLNNPNGKDLYSYWKNTLTNKIIEEIEFSSGDKVLLNVASDEYSKSLDLKAINNKFPVITISFKENKNGSFKVIGMYAKKARGQFIRYIIQNKIKTVTEIKNFNIDGYSLNNNLSNESCLVFTR